MITPVSSTRNPRLRTDRITLECEVKRWSLKRLAYRSTVSEVAIRYLLRGKRQPRADTVALIARALGVSMDYLMDLSDVREVEW